MVVGIEGEVVVEVLGGDVAGIGGTGEVEKGVGTSHGDGGSDLGECADLGPDLGQIEIL